MGDTISAWLGGFAVGTLFILVFQISRIRQRNAAISRVEGKLNLLLRNAGLEYDPYADITDDVAKAVQSGDKILAIKLHRHATDCSLSEAKEFIEELQRRKASNE